MFEVGDYVINSNNGICKIEAQTHLDLDGIDENQMFFMVVPVEEKNARIYIPIEKIAEKARMVMSEAQAMQLVDGIPNVDALEVPNDRLREQIYKSAVLSNDPVKLLQVIKTIYMRREQRAAEGKKNTVIDERYFKMAENNLYDELAFAIGRDRSEIPDLIADRMKQLQVS